ncbi:MAG: hypothetical protein RLZ14_1424, partial [Actinomycetota bacterium]
MRRIWSAISLPVAALVAAALLVAAWVTGGVG